jgi:hypothetical protein
MLVEGKAQGFFVVRTIEVQRAPGQQGFETDAEMVAGRFVRVDDACAVFDVVNRHHLVLEALDHRPEHGVVPCHGFLAFQHGLRLKLMA